MKKIGKIELQNATILDEKEMRNVVGGSGGFDPGHCPVYCFGMEKPIEADTCNGAARLCGGAGIGFCSGTVERCFSDFSGSFENPDDVRDYYGA